MANEVPRRMANPEEICHLSDHNTREDEIAALKAKCDGSRVEIEKLIHERDSWIADSHSWQTKAENQTYERDALKAEVREAKAIAEHWQKRTEQTEKERAEFRDEVARLEGACDKCDLSVMRDTIVRLRALLSRCHGSVGLALNHGLVRRDLLSDLDAELENPVPAVPPCTHNWTPVENDQRYRRRDLHKMRGTPGGSGPCFSP